MRRLHAPSAEVDGRGVRAGGREGQGCHSEHKGGGGGRTRLAWVAGDSAAVPFDAAPFLGAGDEEWAPDGEDDAAALDRTFWVRWASAVAWGDLRLSAEEAAVVVMGTVVRDGPSNMPEESLVVWPAGLAVERTTPSGEPLVVVVVGCAPVCARVSGLALMVSGAAGGLHGDASVVEAGTVDAAEGRVNVSFNGAVRS